MGNLPEFKTDAVKVAAAQSATMSPAVAEAARQSATGPALELAKVQQIPTSYTVAAAQVDAAQESLFANTDDLPPWPWTDLAELCGKPLPGDLVVVGARPANGKTTFMLNLFDALVRSGFPTLYIGAGSEGPPPDARKQWAALRLGVPAYKVMENLWDELPEGSREKVFLDLEEQKPDHAVANFAEVGAKLTPSSLTNALQQFKRNKLSRYVILDHIHRIRFGPTKNQRLELAEATRFLRDVAAQEQWCIFVAAQLHRAPSQHGTLRDLIPPTMSDLKETGTLEEDAVLGLLLHRTKRSNIDLATTQAVARGERPVSDIQEPGRMAVKIGKHRRRGHVMDSTVFLHVNESGRLENAAPTWRTDSPPLDPEQRYGI